MTMKGVKGYILVTLTGLYIVAAIILVLLNIKNMASIWFGQNLDQSSTGWIMIYSALVGFSFYWAIKWMFIGIKSIRAGVVQNKINKVGKLEKLAKSQPTTMEENQPS
jgi:hypothetical protein